MLNEGPVLVIVAHPDDEVLVVTVARLAEEGRSVHLLVIAKGIFRF